MSVDRDILGSGKLRKDGVIVPLINRYKTLAWLSTVPSRLPQQPVTPNILTHIRRLEAAIYRVGIRFGYGAILPFLSSDPDFFHHFWTSPCPTCSLIDKLLCLPSPPAWLRVKDMACHHPQDTLQPQEGCVQVITDRTGQGNKADTDMGRGPSQVSTGVSTGVLIGVPPGGPVPQSSSTQESSHESKRQEQGASEGSSGGDFHTLGAMKLSHTITEVGKGRVLDKETAADIEFLHSHFSSMPSLEKCPKCGYGYLAGDMEQRRGGDEGSSARHVCPKCSYEWVEM